MTFRSCNDGPSLMNVIHTLNERSVEDEIVDLIWCIDRMNVLMVELSESAELRPNNDGTEPGMLFLGEKR